MKQAVLRWFFICCMGSSYVLWSDTPSPFVSESPQLIVHNRVLALVNDKTITVLDVMKEMDLFLQQHYPEQASEAAARFQFYSAQWKNILEQMIDNELILADAKQVDLKISDAEIREQMFQRFGSNLMPTLDRLGLSYEEARQIVYTENVVEKMIWYRVHNNVLQNVGPQDVKAAYLQLSSETSEEETWTYQVVSFRSSCEKNGRIAAEQAHRLLQTGEIPFSSIDTWLAEFKASQQPSQETVSASLSQEYTLSSKQISSEHKQVLLSMQPGAFSAPIQQISRKDQQATFRIFFLKEHIEGTPPDFHSVAPTLHEKLLQNAMSKRSTLYKQKLRQRFGFMQDSSLAEFQPFSLSR